MSGSDAIMSGSDAIIFGSSAIDIKRSRPTIQYTRVADEGIGILTIAAPKLDSTTNRKVFFRIDTDISGSMEGEKLTCVKKCLCKLVKMLLEYKKTYPLFTFYVSIVAFDTELFTISPVIIISDNTAPHLIEQINMMRERGGTAFDKSFKDACTQIDAFKVDHPDATILRLFLSDGEINSGIEDKDVLYDLLHIPNVPVAVIGLCDGHDVETMIRLASSPTSTYVYVVEPESFGLLISDFISNMFMVLTDITINCNGDNQHLYDFHSGWKSSFTIPTLTSEQRRTVYVQGNEGPITINYTFNGIIDTIIVNPESVDITNDYKIALLRLDCIELMRKTLKYINNEYKACRRADNTFIDDTFAEGTFGGGGGGGVGGGSQYEQDDCIGSICPTPPPPKVPSAKVPLVNMYDNASPDINSPDINSPDNASPDINSPDINSPDNVVLEKALKDAIQKLVDFITEHSLQEDTLMNQLCKDLEICLKALFAPHSIAKAFVSARLLSQAEQKCVTISDTRVLDNLTQRYVTGLYDDNFTPYSRTCTSDTSPSCGDIMRSMS
jgi:hypothetical protein